MIEQWEKWVPINGLAPRYNMVALSKNIKGFTISLYERKVPKNKLLIYFKKDIDAYRNTDESFRGSTICDLNEKYGSNIFAWSFFKVINSSYLKWLSEQSSDFSSIQSFIHFVIIDDNNILDIIATYEPEITLFTKQD